MEEVAVTGLILPALNQMNHISPKDYSTDESTHSNKPTIISNPTYYFLLLYFTSTPSSSTLSCTSLVGRISLSAQDYYGMYGCNPLFTPDFLLSFFGKIFSELLLHSTSAAPAPQPMLSSAVADSLT